MISVSLSWSGRECDDNRHSKQLVCWLFLCFTAYAKRTVCLKFMDSTQVLRTWFYSNWILIPSFICDLRISGNRRNKAAINWLKCTVSVHIYIYICYNSHLVPFRRLAYTRFISDNKFVIKNIHKQQFTEQICKLW